MHIINQKGYIFYLNKTYLPFLKAPLLNFKFIELLSCFEDDLNEVFLTKFVESLILDNLDVSKGSTKNS